MEPRLLRRDPTALSPDGYAIGLLALPRMLGVAGALFYPAKPGRRGAVKASAPQAREVLRRAWSIDAPPKVAAVMH
jgi:hypothetical protein